MINKLIGQLATELVDFFQDYGIRLTTQYTPDLPGILVYGRNYLNRTTSVHPVVELDSNIYQNKLLYTVKTPKLASFSPQNIQFAILGGFENASQDYEIKINDPSPEEGYFYRIQKNRINIKDEKDGDVKVRNFSIMEIPISFTVITESVDLIFSISSLFYQVLVHNAALELDLDLFGDGELKTMTYFMNWDRDSLDVSYANFSNTNALNTLSFDLVLSGAIFSEFYREDKIINQYDLQVGVKFLKDSKK